jgi:hypothetical protein
MRGRVVKLNKFPKKERKSELIFALKKVFHLLFLIIKHYLQLVVVVGLMKKDPTWSEIKNCSSLK